MSQTNSTFTAQSSPVVTDYIIVVSNEDDYHCGYHHFAEKVNRKLRAGYQLHGRPFSVNQTLCQAMVQTGGSRPGDEAAFYYKAIGDEMV
jgi:hypothetical protein